MAAGRVHNGPRGRTAARGGHRSRGRRPEGGRVTAASRDLRRPAGVIEIAGGGPGFRSSFHADCPAVPLSPGHPPLDAAR